MSTASQASAARRGDVSAAEPHDFLSATVSLLAGSDQAQRAERRRRALRRELCVRALIALFVLVFNEAAGAFLPQGPNPVVRLGAIAGILVNGPYWIAARTGRHARAQAYARAIVDIILITAGLYGVGGILAAPYLSIYPIIPLYLGITFSSRASLVATATATVSYLSVAVLQTAGWLHMDRPAVADDWVQAIFGLVVLNIIGILTAVLAQAYRRSRRELAQAKEEVERSHDATLRLNREIQRAAHLRTLGELAAGITHEIRNLMNAVSLKLELIARKARDPEIARYVEESREACRAAMDIVQSALTTARRPQEGQTVSVSQVVKAVIALKAYDLRRDAVHVNLRLAPDVPPIAAAPFQLQQVLLNLITNAQEALRTVPLRRVITLVTRHHRGGALIEVQDSGPGIPADVLPRLFEAFYTTKPAGTGVGLAISAGIVRELGGELTAENLPAGGAVFRLNIPAA